MSWLYLVIAGLLEVLWATTMKLSQGLTRPYLALATVVGLILSFGFLALAVRELPLAIAYPIWTGIGAVGAIFAGVLLFHDSISAPTWFFITLLIIGIVGIKITGNH